MLDNKIDPDEYWDNPDEDYSDLTDEEIEQLKEDAEIDRQMEKHNL